MFSIIVFVDIIYEKINLYAITLLCFLCNVLISLCLVYLVHFMQNHKISHFCGPIKAFINSNSSTYVFYSKLINYIDPDSLPPYRLEWLRIHCPWKSWDPGLNQQGFVPSIPGELRKQDRVDGWV